MELKKLKARLKTAQRGHKLLKDKTDEMVRRFSVLAREIKKLRAETEGDVVRVLKQFSLARGLMPKKDIELLFSMPSVSVEPGCGLGNFMNLEVPKIVLEERKDASSPLPYSYVDVTSEADYAVELAGEVLDKLVAARGTGKDPAHARRGDRTEQAGASTRWSTCSFPIWRKPSAIFP